MISSIRLFISMHDHLFFYFLLPMVEKYCVWVKFSKWRFLMIYTYWGYLKPKNTFLAIGLWVCYQHNSKSSYSRNIKFGILHLYHVHMLLETFYKHRTRTLCTGEQDTKEFLYITAYRRFFMLVNFCIFRLRQIQWNSHIFLLWWKTCKLQNLE